MKLLPILVALAAVALALHAMARLWSLLAGRAASELDADESEELLRLAELAERRALLVQQMRNVRFDAELGKVTEADRDALLRRLERQALAVGRELDGMLGEASDVAAADAAVAERTQAVLRGEVATASEWSDVARARHQGRLPGGAP